MLYKDIAESGTFMEIGDENENINNAQNIQEKSLKFVGLYNLSSICYMNATLQQLFMIYVLKYAILGTSNIPKENEAKEIIVEKIPVSFEVKGKGEQHFFGVVNMPNFDIEAFFKQGNENFTIDEDCIRAVGKKGPKNMREVRELLGIPIPDFDKVNLNEEENKIQVKQ